MLNNVDMEKRGISPLIATVLLVGFVIAIAILVWLWYGNVVKERAEKEGQRISGEFSCSSNVRISIDNLVCGTPSSPIVNFDIQNEGIADLNGIRILIQGDVGVETLGISLSLGATTSQKIGESYDASKVGVLSTVTVIPTVRQGSSTITCTEEKVVLTC